MTYTLHHGDCLDILPTLPAQSVDAIIADPPYGTTACKWDSVIPLEPMWAELKRVIKPRGAIVLFAAQPFTSALVMSNAGWFKYAWTWAKERGVGFQIAKYRPMMQTEDVLIFANGSPSYIPQVVPLDKPKREKWASSKSGSSPIAHLNKGERLATFRYPVNLLHFPRDAEKTHPTQKPVDLLAYLIRTYTNEGDTVLDFTMGSGTTGVAAMMERRNFIGIELDAGYFDIAKRRIGEAVADATFGLFAEAAS